MSVQNSNVGVAAALLAGQFLQGDVSEDVLRAGLAKVGLSEDAAQNRASQIVAVSANQAERQKDIDKPFDYIVVGSGASGSVIASRLASKPELRILILEAGSNDLITPILQTENWFSNQGTETDWSFKAEPAVAVNGRSIAQAMGLAVGGSTSINGMVWARGHKNDFVEWERLTGDTRWGYQSVLQTYRRMEDWQGPSDELRRGQGGSVFVQPAPGANAMAPAFLEATRNLGYRVYDQQNGELQESNAGGAAPTEVRIRDGRRLNVAESYLYPILHQEGVTLLTRAYVTRILIEDGAAVGVEFEWNGEKRQAKANAEVIMASGSIQTPKLLMLSGVGDEAQLSELDIATVQHLPGVGENLQDHPIVGGGLWKSSMVVEACNNAAEANLFAYSRAGLDRPDLHIFHIEGPYLSEKTMEYASQDVWSVSPGLARPFSRGSVRLRSRNPKDMPIINANMLGDERDMAALRVGMDIARTLGNSSAMSEFRQAEILPGERVGSDLDALIRDGVMSMHHPTCTAKMGNDDMSVVDPSLRVHSISNLRITDGSIMPTITTGNTQAPCMMIAETLGDMMGL